MNEELRQAAVVSLEKRIAAAGEDGLDDVVAAMKTELDILRKLEPAPEPPGALLEQVELRSYIAAYSQGKQVDGAAAELNQGLGLDVDAAVPLAALETRADAATSVTAGEQNTGVRGVLARMFPSSDMAFLGVNMQTVPAGETRYPVITAGASGAAKSKGDSTDATAATFTITKLNPERLTARYLYAIEDAQFNWGANALENALRADLRATLSNALDNSVLNGNGTSPQPAGIFSKLTDPSNPSAESTWSSYRTAITDAVDGIYAGDESGVRLLIGAKTWQHARTKMRSSTVASRDAIDEMMSVGGRVKATSRIAAPASNVQQAIRSVDGQAIVVPVWSAFTLIRDQFTHSASGQIAMTAHLLHNVGVLRTDGLAQIAFKVG